MTGLEYIAPHAITKWETLKATYRLCQMLIYDGVPGDFVECGVYAGAHPAAMAKAILDFGNVQANWEKPRRVHLFDSFQGIPLSSPHDKDWMRGDPGNRPLGPSNVSSGISACSLEQVKANMRAWGVPEELLVYHPGWFQDTVPVAKIEKIALLRLDGDLYESTKVCLEHLYPKVSHGGWCICDDWTLDGCREAVMPYLMLRENCPIYWRAL